MIAILKQPYSAEEKQRIQLLTDSHDQLSPEAFFNSAINYAIGLGVEAASFLELWREGDWCVIATEFPDYRPPISPGAPSAKTLEIMYGHDSALGEHHRFTRSDWAHEVFAHTTLDGYWEWLHKKLAQHKQN